jgi:hypothetical protein
MYPPDPLHPLRIFAGFFLVFTTGKERDPVDQAGGGVARVQTGFQEDGGRFFSRTNPLSPGSEQDQPEQERGKVHGKRTYEGNCRFQPEQAVEDEDLDQEHQRLPDDNVIRRVHVGWQDEPEVGEGEGGAERPDTDDSCYWQGLVPEDEADECYEDRDLDNPCCDEGKEEPGLVEHVSTSLRRYS